ncbi:MAG: hypothetical protein SFY70_00465 [Bacteroidia bacterium]|nr:hypothetical protein [Bacteroidia bacterium]
MPKPLSYPAFAFRLLLLAGAVGLLAGLGTYRWAPAAYTPALGSVAFATGLALVVYRIASGGLLKAPVQFVGAVMGGMALKVLGSLGCVAVVVYAYRPVAVPLVVVYFSAHVVFTAFEVWALLNNLRANSKTGPVAHT